MDLKQWGKYQGLKSPVNLPKNNDDNSKKVIEPESEVNLQEVPSNLHAPILNQPKSNYNALYQNFPYLYSNPSQSGSTMVPDDQLNSSFVKSTKKDSIKNSESRNFDFIMNHLPLMIKNSKFSYNKSLDEMQSQRFVADPSAIIEQLSGISSFIENKGCSNYDFSLLGKRGNSIFSNTFKENANNDKSPEEDDKSFELKDNRDRRSTQKLNDDSTKGYGRNKGPKHDKKRKILKPNMDLSLEKKKPDEKSKRNYGAFVENQSKSSNKKHIANDQTSDIYTNNNPNNQSSGVVANCN